VIAEEGLVFPRYTARKSDWVACRENLHRHQLSEPTAGAGKFWLPALRVSLQGTLHGRAPWNVIFDYKGRLHGNALALADAARLRLAPNRILGLIEHQPRPSKS
jgi:hypothetical protein